MKPAAFAKITLRICAAALLWLIIFPQTVLLVDMVVNDFQQRQYSVVENGSPADMVRWIVIAAAILAAFVAVVAVVWWRAGFWARFLLPYDSDVSTNEDTTAWEHAGMILIGGILLLKGLMAFITGIFPAVSLSSPHDAPFYLVAGVLLLVGGRTIVRMLLRPFRRA